MKHLVLLLFLLVTGTRAQPPAATTITVGLFTTRVVHNLTITPLAANVWQQSCSTCARIALHAPLAHLDHISHPINLGGSSFRLQPDEGIPSTEAAGRYTISPAPDGLRVTLQLPLRAIRRRRPLRRSRARRTRSLARSPSRSPRCTFAIGESPSPPAPRASILSRQHATARPCALALQDPPSLRPFATPRASLSGAAPAAQASTTPSTAAAPPKPPPPSGPPNTHPTSRRTPTPNCLRRGPAAWQADIPLSCPKPNRLPNSTGTSPRPSPAFASRETYSQRPGECCLSSPAPPALPPSQLAACASAINRALGWNRIRSDLYTVVPHQQWAPLHRHAATVTAWASAKPESLPHGTRAPHRHRDPRLSTSLTPTPASHLQVARRHKQDIAAVNLRTTTPDPALTQAVELAWQQTHHPSPPNRQRHQSPTPLPRPNHRALSSTHRQPRTISSPSSRGDQITLQPLAILHRYGPLEPLHAA